MYGIQVENASSHPFVRDALAGERPTSPAATGELLRLALFSRGKLAPLENDVLHVAIFEERRAEAEACLERIGWGEAAA